MTGKKENKRATPMKVVFDAGEIKTTNQTKRALVSVRKGMREEGVSKNEQVEEVKIACPKGRMRGETPNKE